MSYYVHETVAGSEHSQAGSESHWLRQYTFLNELKEIKGIPAPAAYNPNFIWEGTAHKQGKGERRNTHMNSSELQIMVAHESHQLGDEAETQKEVTPGEVTCSFSYLL